jgi:hypothetical protein
MSGDGEVVFGPLDPGGQPKVTASLSRDFLSVTTKQLGKLLSAEVTRQLQAGMTSSFTKCRRMTLGLSFSSKWQRTASYSFFLSASSVSASVKMEYPRALAS